MCSTAFGPSNDEHIVGVLKYRQLTDKLQYISFTKPDIAFTVTNLCQFMHHPQEAHGKAIKRLLRCFNRTSYDIRITREHDSRLVVYSNFDWAGEPIDQTSTTNYMIYLGRTILWSSKKQWSVSWSYTEEEYHALVAAVTETYWLANLCCELRFSLNIIQHIIRDKVSTTYISENHVFHNWMKHVQTTSTSFMNR